MKTLGNMLGVIAAMALTAAIFFSGYIGARRFSALYSQLDFQAAMITATAATALLLAAFIVAAGMRGAAARNRSVQMQAAKAEVYKLFIGFWEETLRPGRTDEAMLRLSRQMQELNHLLVVFGCTAVLKVHVAMQSMNVPDARAQFASSLLAIRMDLALESRGLEIKELSQLLFSDPAMTPATSKPVPRQQAQPQVSLASNT